MINLNGASVLITGGTGTFGRTLVEAILTNQRPERLVIFSRSEHAQAEMARDLAEMNEEAHSPLRFFVGDVRDRDRLKLALRDVAFVFHAAALKRVDACEYNPQEAIATNVTGTVNLISAAVECGVRQVLGISSDKAAAPTTLYGATKLTMERLLVAANALRGDRRIPRFSAVRYGNVLGSNGSFFHQFCERILQGEPLPITDKAMTRFFWTPDEAIEFALRAMGEMQSGEVLIPKMRAVGLMRMVEVMGGFFRKDPVAYRVVGRQPGEKIHETLITPDEAWMGYDNGDMFALVPNDVKSPLDGGGIADLDGAGYHSGLPDLQMSDTQLTDMIRTATEGLYGDR